MLPHFSPPPLFLGGGAHFRVVAETCKKHSSSFSGASPHTVEFLKLKKFCLILGTPPPFLGGGAHFRGARFFALISVRTH